jgi:hypothetical protein
MALHTGPLYHLKGRSENAGNYNRLLGNTGGLGRDSPLSDPEASIRACPEMFREIHFFSGPVWFCCIKGIDLKFPLFWAAQ